MNTAQVVCPFCNTNNDGDVNYCIKCGKSLSGLRACPMCGSLNPLETKYCGDCGGDINKYETKESAKKFGKGCVYVFVAIATIILTLFFITQCRGGVLFFIA